MRDEIHITSRGPKGWDEKQIKDQFKFLTSQVRAQHDPEAIQEVTEQAKKLVDLVSSQHRPLAIDLFEKFAKDSDKHQENLRTIERAYSGKVATVQLGKVEKKSEQRVI